MKKIITCLSLFTFANLASAQFTFSDDFESYTGGAYLGLNSTTWTTWSGTEGTTEDAVVSTINPHAGVNCVYYSSIDANGGPVDCILPFGTQFTTGTFVTDFWLNVNTGQNAYFNFQQNTTVGEIWNSDWNFKDDGTLTVVNQSGLAFSTTYTQGAWIHLVITAKLNNSEWNINIDGADMGTFHNPSLGISSIDIFPLTGSQFYIDDLSVTHTPYTPTANNIALSYITVPGGLVGSQVNIKALLRNIGTTTVSNPYVSLYNNGSLLGSQTFTGLNIASMDTQIVTLSSLLTFSASNAISLDVQVDAGTANDDDTDDDTLVYNYTPIVPAPGKLVVAEEGTGTWCGWCPRGAVFMELMANTYPGYFQGIAVHNGDPMADSLYDAGVGTLITGYPSALVDRLPSINPSALEIDFITRIQIPPYATIVNGAQWSTGNDSLYVSLTTTFAQAVTSGNYKVACVLIEDSVTGSSIEYNQSNYYAGGGSGAMGGYELLPNPVPAAQMVYEFVARAISPSFAGLANAYTIPAAIGYQKTHTFAFAVPSAWNKTKMKIVGLFIDPTGKVDNASSTDITTAIYNGYINIAAIEPEKVVEKLVLYPNPTSNITTLSLNLNSETQVVVNIYTINGKRIKSNNYGSLNGTQNIEISTADWSNGIYLVEVIAGKNPTVIKLVVQ